MGLVQWGRDEIIEKGKHGGGWKDIDKYEK